MSYVPLKVRYTTIAGISEAMIAMRLPKNSKSDTQDHFGITHLGPEALRGIVVWIIMELQVGFMIEFETYRHGVECLSTSSTMHNELASLSGPALAEAKQVGLPTKVYVRSITASYQALRSMYLARRHHRHPDWQIFCDFIERLPYFEELILAKKPTKVVIDSKDFASDDDVPGCYPY